MADAIRDEAAQPNKPMQTDGRFAAAVDRQGVRCREEDEDVVYVLGKNDS